MKQELDQTLPNIPQENVKVADDTTSFVKNLTPEITNKLLCLYDKLKILTGLQINPSKSTYFTIGPEPSPEFVAGLTIASLDMFTKIQLVQTSIMSKPLHCYWVFAPSKQMLDSMWNVFRQALWTRSFNEKLIKRTKVATKRLTYPVQDGGLGILHVQTKAALSMISSFLSLIQHAVRDRNSLISSILHKDPDKHSTSTMFLNSYHFHTFWA